MQTHQSYQTGPYHSQQFSPHALTSPEFRSYSKKLWRIQILPETRQPCPLRRYRCTLFWKCT
ncbi:hypothetical protein E2C01_021896 [Portunus trituberculatus]|uniref:Uncharacterized protein n=1 Tax=Portunus trituberculatus TaxID=210409 RepID=A0A5B7E651_PORTR|nr:hypothetical protein [Portunus trituberculatus]